MEIVQSSHRDPYRFVHVSIFSPLFHVHVRVHSHKQLCMLSGYPGYPGTRTTRVCEREETGSRPRVRVIYTEKVRYHEYPTGGNYTQNIRQQCEVKRVRRAWPAPSLATLTLKPVHIYKSRGAVHRA